MSDLTTAEIVTADRELTASELATKYGHWNSHPVFYIVDWQNEVVSNYTRLGYWVWTEKQLNTYESEENTDD